MKKAGIILLTLILCAGTVFSFAYTAAPKEKIESDMIARAASLDDIKAALRKTGMFDDGNSMQRKYGSITGGIVQYDAAVDLAAPMTGASGSSNAGDGSAVIFNSSVSADAAMSEAPTSAQTEAADAPEEAGSSNGSFSETNNQIEGIDESDIVKTDGEYIYIASDKHVYIVSADGGNMETAARLDEIGYIRNIFIDKDRLVVFGTNTIADEKPIPLGGNADDADSEDGDAEKIKEVQELPLAKSVSRVSAATDYAIDPIYQDYTEYKTFTYVNIYDTSDKKEPELLQEFSVEGDFVTARKSGDIVYLVSSKYLYGIGDLEKAGSDDILPLYTDSEAKTKGKETTEFGGSEMLVTEPTCVYICPIKESAAFTNLAVIDIAGNEEADIKSYMGSINEFYMNKNSAFLTFNNYEYNEKTQTSKEYTDIIALDIDGKNVTYRADGTVDGSLLNQFSMDEYDGYFRIATTEWDWNTGDKSSNLFVLDDKLETVGSIRDIAEGEQIYSVRFMGNRGYIVTFETMDPFFTVDLSDPAAPKIAGELKLPGYSNYLHQIDENTVLGIGRQTKELITRDEFGNEEAVGFRQGGIKLSLFDISDFANPKELDSYVLGDDSIWSDALYDHKAIMVNNSEKLIGICAQSYSSGSQTSGAYLFDVGNGSVMLEGSAEITVENNYISGEYGESAFYYSRLCYLGNTYYYLNDGTIYAMQLDNNDFEIVEQLKL